MTIALPAPIAAYFAADRASDAQALLDCFTPGAQVRDEGETYRDHDGIARWIAQASAKYTYVAEPVSLIEEGGATVVTSHLTGDFPGSPVDLRYRFTLAEGRIAGLEIAP